MASPALDFQNSERDFLPTITECTVRSFLIRSYWIPQTIEESLPEASLQHQCPKNVPVTVNVFSIFLTENMNPKQLFMTMQHFSASSPSALCYPLLPNVISFPRFLKILPSDKNGNEIGFHFSSWIWWQWKLGQYTLVYGAQKGRGSLCTNARNAAGAGCCSDFFVIFHSITFYV